MLSFRDAVIVLFLSALFLSCAQREVHVHDRHGLSFPLVESYAKKHPETTLVLLDYHHDVGPFDVATLSSNWVGKLIAEKKIGRVLWVSGRDLLLPNRNARIAWLHRSLSAAPPEIAALIEDRLVLADWHELESRRIDGPVAVSLDFDIFCRDPGNPPDRFLGEIAGWISRQRPGLLTLALSAAYQEDAVAAWGRLDRFANASVADDAEWFLEAGARAPIPEGEEESSAWRRWESFGKKAGLRGGSFLPGSAIWIAPPAAIRATLLSLGTKPGDDAAKDALQGWRDADLAALERSFPFGETDTLLAAAAVAIEQSWNGSFPLTAPLPTHSPNSAEGSAPDPGYAGLALRILGPYGDRGCLALPRGVSDLISAVTLCASGAVRDPRYPPVEARERESVELELSLFGPWRGMDGPLDFRPGLDSLLLVRGSEATLLQASVAALRGYGREEFLGRLANKAGLGTDGWRETGLRFERAATIWRRKSLWSIESSPDYQKYAKK